MCVPAQPVTHAAGHGDSDHTRASSLSPQTELSRQVQHPVLGTAQGHRRGTVQGHQRWPRVRGWTLPNQTPLVAAVKDAAVGERCPCS